MTQAHIHVGQKTANGGIAAFLCTNLGNGPVGTQACPAPPARITGVITAGRRHRTGVQGVAAGELDEVIEALRDGVAYANVHSTFPGRRGPQPARVTITTIDLRPGTPSPDAGQDRGTGLQRLAMPCGTCPAAT